MGKWKSFAYRFRECRGGRAGYEVQELLVCPDGFHHLFSANKKRRRRGDSALFSQLRKAAKQWRERRVHCFAHNENEWVERFQLYELQMRRCWRKGVTFAW